MTRRKKVLSTLDQSLATAILGIDTLWGGDVTSPSGVLRFIADCWFSDEPLPDAYTHPLAEKLRQTGGVSAKSPDRVSIDAYRKEIDVPGAIRNIRKETKQIEGIRRITLNGLASSLEVMWDCAKEVLGEGEPVPYERCVRAATGNDPEPSRPESKRKQLADLLRSAGYDVSNLNTAVSAWRSERLVPRGSIRALSDAFIAQLDSLTMQNVVSYLPSPLRDVPRANVRFIPIQNASFSGSMNYLGHARKSDGTPEYEANYEINASLQISIPEFQHLISHETVPGHATTFAYLQNLYVRKKVGFESSVLTVNSLTSTLFEGIANHGVLMAYGVTKFEDLPDPDLQIGVLLSLLQDDAKNQASFLTWNERVPQEEMREILQRDFLVSAERAEELSGPWAQHPIMGRMSLPAYRAGTELVSKLRRNHPPKKILPLLFGCSGLVDAVSIQQAL